MLRGIRLSESGKEYQIVASETWETGALETAAGGAAPDGAETAADADGEEAHGAEGDMLADAFAAAVKTFGTHEFVLAMPLSRMLVETVKVPLDRRDELDAVAAEELKRISPFPDEAYRAGVEVVAETDRELCAVVAALPDAVSLEIGDALDAAKARIVRTDVTALGRLRTLWPKIVSGGTVGRRLVLMDLDDGWDFMVLDDDAPVALRGLGAVDSAAELGREVMLGLIRCENVVGMRDVGEVVVVTAGDGVAEDVTARLGAYGPVRVEKLGEDDAYAGVEGVANRTAEEAPLDVTPFAWDTALKEARLKKRLTLSLAAAGGVWALAMAVLFGVPFGFGWLTDRQKAASKRHHAVYQKVKDTRDRVKLVQRYSDHARGALETLKVISDRLPEGVTLSQLQYRRGDSVHVWAEAAQPTDAYAFKKALDKASLDDDSQLFGEVTLSEVKQTRAGGHKFDIDAKFAAEADDSAPAQTKAKGGR